MWTFKFWKRTGERALKAAANGALLLYSAPAVLSVGDVDALKVLGGAGLAALISVLMSIVSSGVGDDESPSLVE